MRTATKLVGAATSALVVTAGVAGIAHAAASPAATTASVTSIAADSDSLQQGDQTSPDPVAHPANVLFVPAASTAAPAAATSPSTTSNDSAGVNETAGETSNETAGESSTETAGASDGPGGHADPAGDVQHEGGANEQ